MLQYKGKHHWYRKDVFSRQMTCVNDGQNVLILQMQSLIATPKHCPTITRAICI